MSFRPVRVPTAAHSAVRLFFEECNARSIFPGHVFRQAGFHPRSVHRWRTAAPNIYDVEIALNVLGYELKAVRRKKR